MEILKKSVYHIDWSTSEVSELPMPEDDSDFEQYIEDLLEKIAKGQNKREFKFGSTGTEVYSRITDIIGDLDFQIATKAIATRLMQKESATSAETSNLKHDIPKGFVIQILFKDDNNTLKLIISKSDHSAYLDKNDLKRHLGLPIDKKTYKAFLTDINTDNSLGKIYILDTTTHLAKYWWYDFLELVEMNTDISNTNVAFDSVDKLLNGIKAKHPADHTILRNAVIGYFKSTDKFDLDEFVGQAFDNYHPEDPELEMDTLRAKLRDLPAKSGFDSQFNVISNEISGTKIKNIIHLTGKIDLVLRDKIDDLRNVIVAFEENGVKYIRIRTDAGYNSFNK